MLIPVGIIDDNLNVWIDVLCCIFCYFPDLFPVFRIIITESLEMFRFFDGISDTTCHLQSPVLKELSGDVQCFLLDNQQITVCFKIYLVNLQLPGDFIPPRQQIVYRIVHLAYVISCAIDRYFKVLILLRKTSDKKKGDQNSSQMFFHNKY